MFWKIPLAAVGGFALLLLTAGLVRAQSSDQAVSERLNNGGARAEQTLKAILKNPDAYSASLLVSCAAGLRQQGREGDASALAKKALAKALRKPEEQTPLVLFLSAAEAYRDTRLEDSAFLFYAGQQRTRFEKVCFVPRETGGDDPFVAVSAIASELGQTINPAAMAQPKIYAQAMARLGTFTPQVPPGYDPGYEFRDKKSVPAALAATAEKRQEFVTQMSALATLLNDPAYFKAFQTIQAYNLGTRSPRPGKSAYAEARAAIKRIEQERGFKVISADESE